MYFEKQFSPLLYLDMHNNFQLVTHVSSVLIFFDTLTSYNNNRHKNMLALFPCISKKNLVLVIFKHAW
jgi:hypothetical protein